MGSATKDRLVLTVVFAAGVVLTLAVFNVAGWGFRWVASPWLALLFCGVAFFCEFLGFNLAIAAERQWEVKRMDRFSACVYSLIVCALVNVVSGHNAWTEFERMMLAPQVLSAQVALDRERGALLDQIVIIDRQLDAARPLPQAAAGPLARGEAREVYQLEIARLQPRREALQAQLDRMPVVATVDPIITPALVWVAFALIEVMKALVLWGIGVNLDGLSARLRGVAAAGALAAQLPSSAPEPPAESPAIPEPQERVPPTLDLEQMDGRALLDQLVANNVITMSDVASRHAARPRPGRRKRAA